MVCVCVCVCLCLLSLTDSLRLQCFFCWRCSFTLLSPSIFFLDRSSPDLHEETVSQLDYIRDVIIDNRLYEPELFSSHETSGLSGGSSSGGAVCLAGALFLPLSLFFASHKNESTLTPHSHTCTPTCTHSWALPLLSAAMRGGRGRRSGAVRAERAG